MTCFSQEKVCENKTIHLISHSFPLPSFLLENMHVGLDVSCRQGFGVSHSPWLPLRAALPGSALPPGFVISKLAGGHTAPAALWPRPQGGQTLVQTPTLCNPNQPFLSPSSFLLHLCRYTLNCIKHCGKGCQKHSESQGEWRSGPSTAPEVLWQQQSGLIRQSLPSFTPFWLIQAAACSELQQEPTKAKLMLPRPSFWPFCKWVQCLFFSSHWGHPQSWQYLKDDRSGPLITLILSHSTLGPPQLVLWAWSQEMGWEIFTLWFWSHKMLGLFGWWNCAVEARGTQNRVPSSHSSAMNLQTCPCTPGSWTCLSAQLFLLTGCSGGWSSTARVAFSGHAAASERL